MVARALRTLLPAVVLLAAPLYLFAHVSLTQRESRGLTVQTDAAEQPVLVGQGGAAPRVQLNFYGEALCPDCAQFTSKVLAPLFITGVSSVFTLHYVGWGNAVRKHKGAVKCQHGPRECDLNRVLNCAQQLSSNQDAFFRFLVCVEDGLFGGLLAGDQLLPACAATAHLNATVVAECADGAQGRELEARAERDTPSDHTFVPWVTIDGRAVGAECGDVGALVCAAYQGPTPDACADQPVKQPCPGAPKRLALRGESA